MEINNFYKNAGNCDGVLRGIMSRTDATEKSTGFIMVLDCKVLLIDSGNTKSTETLSKLCELRKNISPNGQLRIVWVLSHYHNANAAEAIESLIPDARFSFEKVYLPPIPEVCQAETEAIELHSKTLEALNRFQPKAEIHALSYADKGGFREVIDHAGSRIVIMPPVSETCPVWLRLSYAGRRLLFPGTTAAGIEAMFPKWSEFMTKMDFIAWPGDNSDKTLLSLKPKNILTMGDSVCDALAKQYPEETKKVKFYNCATEDVLFEIDPDGELIFND